MTTRIRSASPRRKPGHEASHHSWIESFLRMLAAAAAIALLDGGAARAEVRLAGVFRDHMVLQRESPVPVWGWAEPGEKVTVEFSGQRKSAAAAADGRWQVTLDPLKADANPASLTVSSSMGGQPLVREDIVVGEVWLIAGQSNAGMALKECLNPEEEIAAANDPLLRHMTNTHVFDGRGPRPDAECTWQVTTPQVAGDFNAVPYFFGRSLRRKLGVPVGVIALGYGGSRIEAWMSPAALATTEWGRETIAAWRGKVDRGDRMNDLDSIDHPDHPAAIFNGKVAPLAPFAVAGSIWYQGENNASDGSAGQYADLMPLLIADWRRLWHRDDLPFLLVQLPNFTGRPHWLWPPIRQAVFDAAATVPHTRMIVTIDVGDPDDIHPKNKAPVGERLALQAMNLVYGDSNTVASGPLYRSATFADGRAVIEFDHVGGGLEAKGGPLREFTIAGADGKFVEAAAEIEGDRVIVHSPAVAEPVAVRYGWVNNPRCNLFNREGLPAAPFRSDARVAAGPQRRTRRALYNFDGCSCMFTKAGGKGPVPLVVDDVKRLIEEVAYEDSRIDTVLVCINCQVMYYPTIVGTMYGKPPAESADQFTKNLATFYDAGVDPYAVMLAESRRRGREALLSFRMNDDHGDAVMTTQFWVDHPDCRLGRKALDFGREEVRDYTFRLIEEAVKRYDCDGIELDFNRFPNFFKDRTTEERVATMNGLVQRVRGMLDDVGRDRGRRLTLSVRVPSNYNDPPPTPATALEKGCDVVAWAKNGWVDFVTVSEWLFERGDLPIAEWKRAITSVPVYGGIECTVGKGRKNLSAEEYRRAAEKLVREGADGVYLFNFFTSREEGKDSYEPPFEVFRDLGR